MSPSSLEDECTLVGVVGRKCECPLSEDVRPVRDGLCERFSRRAPSEGGEEGAERAMVGRESVGANRVSRYKS